MQNLKTIPWIDLLYMYYFPFSIESPLGTETAFQSSLQQIWDNEDVVFVTKLTCVGMPDLPRLVALCNFSMPQFTYVQNGDNTFTIKFLIPFFSL